MDQDIAAILSAIRQMPPWEANTYFDLPRVTYTSLSTGVTTQVIGADPRRVGLLMSNSGTALTVIGPTNTIVNSGIGAVQGLVLASGNTIFQITHQEYGLLVAQPWFAACNTAGTVFTVIEVTLRVFPGQERRGTNRVRKGAPGSAQRGGWDDRQSPRAS